MKRILVLQMCRLGDILQTTPMLRGIRRTWPEAHVTLVLHDVFRTVPVPTHLFDRLSVFPYSQIAQTLSTAKHEWPREMTRIREWVRDLGTEPFDLLINLTHSDLAGFLTTLIPHRTLSGGRIAPDRTRVVDGVWMTYFWASQAARAQGCFNLVDVQNYAAGVASDGRPLEMAVPESAHERMAAWLNARGLGSRPLIAVQLGASEERKRWPADQVALAVNQIDTAAADIVFVGARDESALAERARARLIRPAEFALGETSITELAALLNRADLLLTNDTGTMHVASAMGTRIVDLSTGNVFVHETAPYGEGHFVLEPRTACFPCTAGATCHHFACREAFTPDDVSALMKHALGWGPLPTPSNATILQGRFVRGGRVQYRPLWPAAAGAHERRRQAAAMMWAETLPAPENVEVAATVDPYPDRLSGIEPADVLEACTAFAAKGRAVARIAAAIPQAGAARQSRLAIEIEEGLRELQILGQMEPVLQPVASYLKVRLDSAAVRDVSRIAKIYEREARAAGERAARMAALLAPDHAMRRVV